MSYLRNQPYDEKDFPAFAAIREQLGFLPNFFVEQTARPDMVDAEISHDRQSHSQRRRAAAKAKRIHFSGVFGGEPQHLLRDRTLRNGAHVEAGRVRNPSRSRLTTFMPRFRSPTRRF